MDQDRSKASGDFGGHSARDPVLPHAARQLGTTVLGYDNAHAIPHPKKFKFAGRRLPYDHRHRTSKDKGVPYEFESPQRLLEDFFAEVDRVIKEAQQ